MLQGEREMASGNKSLGKFQLTGIPPAPRGMPQIEVTFDIDANGILHVSAKDLGTGKEQKIEIKGGSGLDESEVEQMIKDAEAHADEDRRQRELAEARNVAENAAYQAEKQLGELGDKVDSAPRRRSRRRSRTCATRSTPTTPSEIRSKTDALQAAFQKVSEQIYAAAAEQQAAVRRRRGRQRRRRRGGGRGRRGRRRREDLLGGRADEREATGAESPESEEAERPAPTPSRRPMRPAPRSPRTSTSSSEAKRERDEYLELAQRTRADFENYRKRVAKEAAEARAAARPSSPASCCRRSTTSSAPCSRRTPPARTLAQQALARGVALVLDELRRKLQARRGRGLSTRSGSASTPSCTRPSRPGPRRGPTPGVVVETVEKGYRLNGQVLRPARVVVSD